MFIIKAVLILFHNLFMNTNDPLLEDMVLRQQLAVQQQTIRRPKLRNRDRWFWSWLSRLWSQWKSALIICCEGDEWADGHQERVLLGLNRSHSFSQYLFKSKRKNRVYYGLKYLAHELAACQKLLVPYSPFCHLVKNKLVRDMRKTLVREIMETKQPSHAG